MLAGGEGRCALQNVAGMGVRSSEWCGGANIKRNADWSKKQEEGENNHIIEYNVEVQLQQEVKGVQENVGEA